MVDAWLMAHWTPLALGLMALTPIGERSNLFPDARRRITIGLGLILLGGFTISTHTYVIHLQLAEGAGTTCQSGAVFSCGDVIGDERWNSFLTIPWGIIGMVAFSVLGFLLLCTWLEPGAAFVERYLGYGRTLTLVGVVPILWLVIVELFLVEDAPQICQYCSTAHAANILAVAGFTQIANLRGSDRWGVRLDAASGGSKQRSHAGTTESKTKRSAQGYVAPVRRTGLTREEE